MHYTGTGQTRPDEFNNEQKHTERCIVAINLPSGVCRKLLSDDVRLLYLTIFSEVMKYRQTKPTILGPTFGEYPTPVKRQQNND